MGTGTKARCRGPREASSTVEWALTSERLRAPGLPHACFQLCELPELKQCPDSNGLRRRKSSNPTATDLQAQAQGRISRPPFSP